MAEMDLSGALSKLLEDPEALARVMSVAGSLLGSAPAAPAETEPAPPEPQPKSEPEAVQASALPKLAQQLQGKSNDPRCTLLSALKPYMRPARAERIDAMVQAIRLADMAGGLLGGKKLF